MDFAQARARMVQAQIARRGVRDPAVLQAMGSVPREAFLDAQFRESAYEDRPLPIPEGQTISQPYIVAAMLEAAELKPEARVLEIGAGSGYAAAIVSRIVREVYGIERHDALTQAAVERLHDLGYTNIELKTGDGSHGWPERAPFDAIIVSAGGPSVPEALKRQLRVGGVLVAPVGEPGDQRLKRITRSGEADYKEDALGAVRFVKLIGAGGWPAP